MDQVFFAAQQDLIFLGLCAYSHANELPKAIEEVKRCFLTTWIIDCSLWPVINFFGFSFVPVHLQPAYMAVVSLFWQIYISSMAMAADAFEDKIEHERLLEVFQSFDIDKVIEELLLRKVPFSVASFYLSIRD